MGLRPDVSRGSSGISSSLHLHRESGLLFICTSRRLEVIYRDLALKIAGEEHDILPVPVINRVLRGIDGPEAFSVGIRNRIHTAAEAYRIMLGPNAVRAITRSRGRMYHRGHAVAIFFPEPPECFAIFPRVRAASSHSALRKSRQISSAVTLACGKEAPEASSHTDVRIASSNSLLTKATDRNDDLSSSGSLR